MTDQLNKTDRTLRNLIWSARILTILFAFFLSIFSFDAYNENAGFWMNAFAFFMHLIPVWIMLAVLAVSWRYEWVGAFVFSLLGMVYIAWAWGRFPLSVYFLMAGPCFLISLLFYLGWHRKSGRRVIHA